MRPDPTWLNALQMERNRLRVHFAALGIAPDHDLPGHRNPRIFMRYHSLTALITLELEDAIWM